MKNKILIILVFVACCFLLNVIVVTITTKW